VNLADHLHYLGPALALFVGAGVVMLADLFSDRRAPLWGLALIAVVVSFIWTVNHSIAGTDGEAIATAIVVDSFSLFFTYIIVIVTAAVIVAGREWIATLDRAPEFYALLLTSAGAMALLVQSNDLITIFVALETTSIAQFILVGIVRTDRSAEASLKYLFTGAIAAAILLYGFAFLFGLSGTTSLQGIADYVLTEPEAQRVALIFAFVLVAAGVGFKMAIAPFHAWAPDVYQGAPPQVATFLSVASKAAGFALVLRIFYTGLGGGDTFIAEDWAILFGVLAVLSMIFGNTGALLQTNARRLLGYSSIAQAGNIAVGLAAVAAGSTIGASGVLFFLGGVHRDEPRRVPLRQRDLAAPGIGRDQRLRGPRTPRADDRGGPLHLPALAHRHPAHGRLHREDLHLQQRRADRPRVADRGRRHRGREHRDLRLLLPALDAHDVAR
jgi:NADH-quinone oxidoreductase subunit N